MLILVFVKAFSVMFHALNYRFLDLDGETDAWTIIFYVVHLLKVNIKRSASFRWPPEFRIGQC